MYISQLVKALQFADDADVAGIFERFAFEEGQDINHVVRWLDYNYVRIERLLGERVNNLELMDRRAYFRMFALLGRLRKEESVPFIVKYMDDRIHDLVRKRAIEAAGAFPHRTFVEPIVKLLRGSVDQEAAKAFRHFVDAGVVEVTDELLSKLEALLIRNSSQEFKTDLSWVIAKLRADSTEN